MFASFRNNTYHSSSKQPKKQEKQWLSVSFKPENFIPGLVIGFILGFILDIAKPNNKNANSPSSRSISGNSVSKTRVLSGNTDEGLKMVLVVRGDLKMGAGKVASQCAHAATGIYAELIQSDRSLLRQWEQSGQAKIVVTCKNLQEMNKLKESADIVGLPTFVVADAGRTQVSS
ncbi:hypothetical protein LIER_37216 [Lithospermum erythrorhizon]|uniref:peptidyl-tRNA hydrolase n=1 Tax=Lithospermum erythrorhizon TaxID=34254 RepID=A0AAV3PIC0_LITER